MKVEVVERVSACTDTAFTVQDVDLSISLPEEDTVVTVILLAVEVVGGVLMLFMENEKEDRADIAVEKTEVTSMALLRARHEIEEVREPDTLVQVMESLVTGGYEEDEGLAHELG